MPPTALNPDHWIKSYKSYLFNYAITRVNDTYEAEELVAETLCAALTSHHNFKAISSERTWLTGILKFKIIDLYRKKNTSKARMEVVFSKLQRKASQDRETVELEDTSNCIERSLQSKEILHLVYEHLSTLPAHKAEIFKDRTIKGLSTEKICLEYDITPARLWSLIHRVRKSTLLYLKERGYVL